MLDRAAALVFLASLAGICSGCLERKETIRIAADGGVHVEIEYNGERPQFRTADALPSEEAGWPVEREIELTDDGKEELTLTARRGFDPREPLPASYAAPGDPDADLYLQFPTRITTERRPDGVYMHFRRTYSARPWAYIQYWQDLLIDDDIKKRAEKPLDAMTHEDRVRIIKAFAGFEAFKQTELLRAALREMDAELPQDAWLRARQALFAAVEATDWDAVVERVNAVPGDQGEQAFESESQRILERTRGAFVDELARGTGWRHRRLAELDAGYDRAHKAHQITGELGGHAFRIRVYMPGEIVAHNGDNADEDWVEWEFGGDAVRDRAHELLVTARVSGKHPYRQD